MVVPAASSPGVVATSPPRPPSAPPLHAAIDIGTNSMHLVVARADEHGGFDLLTTEKEMVRLGSGDSEMKRLAPDAIERGLAALQRMVDMARSLEVDDLSIVATSAVREAENRNEFCDPAEKIAGVEISVISGFEEARLIHLGVLQALSVFDQRRLVVDIGGGSTEFVIGEQHEAIEARSMKLGALRLTQRFFGDRHASTGAVNDCRQFVRAALAPMAHDLVGHQPEVAIGSSGTIETVAAMIAAHDGIDAHQLNGFTFTAEQLSDLVARLEESTTDERRRMLGLEEKRVDIILGGAILLDEIFRAMAIDEMSVSTFALREGVLLDRFGGASHVGLSRLSDLRKSNVERLARQLDPDPHHALQTAELAVQLFDRTSALHDLDAVDRELLWSAAVVHNVGLFISHSSHHKHSYYVVRNSEQLTGFSDHEIEVMALLTRYHRKSHPAPKHREFAALSETDQKRVRILAGLLRVSIGLDRRHAAAVRSVRVHLTPGESILIEPVPRAGEDIEVEVYAATQRSRLLAKALGVEVIVRPPETGLAPAAST